MSNLTDTVGHRIRKALDVIAGKPTGRLDPLSNRRANTFRLTTMNDVDGLRPDQDEFIMAIIQFERLNKRSPDMKDVLEIVHCLGYRKS